MGETHMQGVVTQMVIEPALHGAHGCPQQHFLLGGQAGLHICLDATEQKGPQQVVQLGHYLALLLLSRYGLLARCLTHLPRQTALSLLNVDMLIRERH